ncbi:MAG: DUF1858 domain-containing protein [bacterium]
MDQSKQAAQITPDTKVATLLADFPELEPELLRLSPEFAKLRNPILRRTVAKITSLRQAAKIAGLPLGEMINSLRRAAGFDEIAITEGQGSATQRPDWIDKLSIWRTFDARPILESGGNPMGEVIELARSLPDDVQLVLQTSFLPAPLIEILTKKGMRVWSDQSSGNNVVTHIANQEVQS